MRCHSCDVLWASMLHVCHMIFFNIKLSKKVKLWNLISIVEFEILLASVLWKCQFKCRLSIISKCNFIISSVITDCKVFRSVCHFVPRGGGYEVTSCLVPCSFQWVTAPRRGRGSLLPGGHCSSQYASYWNAILFQMSLQM